MQLVFKSITFMTTVMLILHVILIVNVCNYIYTTIVVTYATTMLI
jgi:hypothetical protein